MKKILLSSCMVMGIFVQYTFANETMNMSEGMDNSSMMTMSGNMMMSGGTHDTSMMTMTGAIHETSMNMKNMSTHSRVSLSISSQIDTKIARLSLSKLEKLNNKVLNIKNQIWLGKLKFKNNDFVLSVLNYINESSSTKLTQNSNINEKIYVADEGDSSVGVIDSKNNKVIKSIDLSEEKNGEIIYYSAHNVQVSPNGKIVAVTANVLMGDDTHTGESEHMEDKDQIIFIDPLTDIIIGRVNVETGAHLAHVVINYDATFAYFVSQEKGKIYILSLKDFKIEKMIYLPIGSQPHGIRLSKDDNFLYIAFLGKQALGVFDTKTDTIEYYPLGDKAVQTAVTPDNKYAFVSLYTTKRIARFDIGSKTIDFIDLPKDAQGPVQIYPSPDSNYLYVADQGYYFGSQTGHQIYKIDIKQAQVISSLTGGDGPHGIVVSLDGNYVYVTNLLSHNISVIDIKMNSVIHTINVGKTPNGISVWTKNEK